MEICKNDYLVSNKPTLDAEPSYEWILQGLHDNTQPYWKAKQVRRYAYWSVFREPVDIHMVIML